MTRSRRLIPVISLLALGVGLAFAPPEIRAAGQTITINSNVDHSVHGNGTSPDGGLPHDADPNDNTVNVSGGTVTGGVFGANSGGEDITGNEVTVSNGTITGDSTDVAIYGGVIGSS
ncbi:MAG: hypothetical protein LBD06_09485, partial [Candidatus Accumulibacter sp.]|nr:hypothetical protein [Accumulibacter sp.]